MPDKQLVLPGMPTPETTTKKPHRSKGYIWELGSPPPALGKHSLAKHEVLRAYLEKYVAVLVSRPVQEHLKLTLVDGFAGGGVYSHPESGDLLSGSPLIMLEAMNAAENAANESRRKNFALDVQYIFVEKHTPTTEFLNGELKAHEIGAEQSDRIQVLRGCFSDYLDQIFTAVEKRGRSRRVIFVLDQYGFTDVRMADLRRIFSRLPNAEVILTVAIDWLIDHWTEKANYDRILTELGINLTADFASQTKHQCPNDWRGVIQNTLHSEFRSNSGASYYTPFFIHSVDSHRAYWLLHFSGHSKARDVMMQLHWELENHFQHFGRPGFGMLGYDPQRGDNDAGQMKLPYEFDESAGALTREALLEDIPKLINHNGVPFDKFFESKVNDSPATKQMLAEQIRELSLNKELEIRTHDGSLRRNGVQINNDDIIVRPRQRLLLP